MSISGLKRNTVIYLIWVLAALFTSTQLYLKTLDAGTLGSWPKLFFVQLLVWSVWGALSPFIFWLGKRFRIDRQTYYRGLLLHLGFAVILVLFYLAAYSVIWNVLGTGTLVWMTFKQYFKLFFLNLFHWHFFIYMAIIGVAHAVQYRAESEERSKKAINLEKQLLTSELNTLKAQLSPHFLFNTINNVIGTIEQGKNKVASGMLFRLGAFLRTTLEESRHKLIPLEKEIAYLKQYLDIEKFRNQKLEVVIAEDESAMDFLVPNFILQPIVENAIKHGIAKAEAAHRIEIGMEQVDENLKLWVYNEGPLLNRVQHSGQKGIGLSNITSRLEVLYGGNATFKLFSVNRGVLAEITLPLESKG